MIRSDLPAWRSMLFCPAHVERFVARAHERDADAVILDLEDSVSNDSKSTAREAVRGASQRVGRRGADVLVRINRPLELAVRDIEAAVGPNVSALMLPKTEGPDHVRLLAEVVAGREAALGLTPGITKFVVLVENARALLVAHAIASADQRVVAMAVGGEDMASDIGAEPTPENLFFAKMQGLHAARAAGIVPLGLIGSVAGLADDDAFIALALRSRKAGFEGATCVHPRHVAFLNEGFGASNEELDHASRLIAAMESSTGGAFLFDGNMVDAPIIARAQRLLSRARRDAARRGRSTSLSTDSVDPAIPDAKKHHGH